MSSTADSATDDRGCVSFYLCFSLCGANIYVNIILYILTLL